MTPARQRHEEREDAARRLVATLRAVGLAPIPYDKDRPGTPCVGVVAPDRGGVGRLLVDAVREDRLPYEEGGLALTQTLTLATQTCLSHGREGRTAYWPAAPWPAEDARPRGARDVIAATLARHLGDDKTDAVAREILADLRAAGLGLRLLPAGGG